jgi:porphyrinogen peroxidase
MRSPANRLARGIATVAEETSSCPYRHDRDLTGFIDGTENPTLIEAPKLSVIGEDAPGAGGTVLLLQKSAHDRARGRRSPTPTRNR